MNIRKIAVAVMTLMALGMPAWANTRFGFGTIVAVDADGSQSKDKVPSYTVQFECRNLAWTAIWYRETYPLQGKTRQGARVYFLDDKPSTPLEALKVGRAICHTANDMIVYVSSKPGPHVLGATGNLNDGLLRVELPGALQVTAAKSDRFAVGEMKPLVSSLTLVLDLAQDHIAGMAVLGVLDELSDHALDCSQLKREGGKLVGPVSLKVTLPALKPQEAGYKLDQGDTITLAANLEISIGADGAVTGKYTGTSNGKATAGDVRGLTVARSAKPARPRAVIQLKNIPHIEKGYLVLTFANGKAETDGLILFSKGDQRGKITAADLQLDGTTLKGTLTGVITGKESAPVNFTLDARVLANRFMVGDCRMAVGEQVVTVTLRGGLCEADTCRIGPGTKEQDAQVKLMQAAPEK